MQKKFLFCLLLLPQIWCFSQNSKFEEFNTQYKLATQENRELALKSGFKALEIAQNINNDSLVIKAFAIISYNYKHLGNLVNALTFVLQSENYYKTRNDSLGLSILYIQIAGIYSGLKNEILALEYSKKSLDLELSLKDRPLGYIALNYINLGEHYRNKQIYDSALYYYEMGKNIDIQRGASWMQGYINCNSGLVYAALGESNKSDSLISLGIALLNEIKDYNPIAETYGELAKIALKNNEIEKAYNYATQAYQIADTNQLVLELKETSLLLSQLNNKKGNYKEAYTYLTAFNDYNQKIASDSVVSKLAEMRAEFEISQNETEMSYLKKISKVRTNLLIVSLLGMLAIAILALYLLRLSRMLKLNNLRLSEFNEELNQKNHIIDMALQEKEMLMKEIHHRVKNNLQIISSIISLQSNRIEDPKINEIFNEMQRRILAISAIHQKLYQGNSVSLINMKDYLEEVVESIHSSLTKNTLSVACEMAIQNMDADIDTAVALGLIVNELVTNAYKYAFKPNRTNTLTLTLIRTPQSTIELTLHDNGPGMPEGFNLDNSSSLGLRMVNLLIRQHKGKLEYHYENGTRIEISIKPVE